MSRTTLSLTTAVAPALAAGNAWAIDSSAITRYKAYRPFLGNHPYVGNDAALVEEGRKVWYDPKLSTNGLSCNTCHQADNAFRATFAMTVPRRVEMAASRRAARPHILARLIRASRRNSDLAVLGIFRRGRPAGVPSCC